MHIKQHTKRDVYQKMQNQSLFYILEFVVKLWGSCLRTVLARNEIIEVSLLVILHQWNIFSLGTAGDSLSYHRGMAFTTKDRDNDPDSSNCATMYKGAWWFKNCLFSDLNGLYLHGQHSNAWEGVNLYHWKGSKYSAKRAELKIKPVDT